MLPGWIKQLGPKRMVFWLTLLATCLSLGITLVLRWALTGRLYWDNLIIPMAVPLLMTPVLGVFFVKILFELDLAQTRLALLSVTDDLTGVYNRRYFMERLQYELARAQRYGQVFSVLMIDMDNFKHINDQYGHPAGDEILKMVARVCRRESRQVDVLTRWGGDEFGYLAPGLGPEEAVQFADRVREMIGSSRLLYRTVELQITVSVGVITWCREVKDREKLIFLMDEALYAAKRGGKNKTLVANVAQYTQG